MKKYFYLTGDIQNGPYTIDELKGKELTSETLAWTEGMGNWEKIKEIPELLEILNIKLMPPPPPTENKEKNFITEVSGQIKVTTEKTPNPTIEAIKPTRTSLKWLIIWCSFHLFALLMSYSQIEIFSDDEPETDKFWPFVEFSYNYQNITDLEPYSESYTHHAKIENKTHFNGIFIDYDITEFLFYVGGAIILFVIFKLSNKVNE